MHLDESCDSKRFLFKDGLSNCTPLQGKTVNTIGPNKQDLWKHKIVNNFLIFSFNICCGAQKNCLIKTVLLSTHNLWFGR